MYRKTFPHRRHRQCHQQHKSQYICIHHIYYRRYPIVSYPLLLYIHISLPYTYLCTPWKSQKIILFIIHQCLISFLFCYSLCSSIHSELFIPAAHHLLYPLLSAASFIIYLLIPCHLHKPNSFYFFI